MPLTVHVFLDLARDLLWSATGWHLVGVRYQDGEDFPLVSTRGYSEEFLRVERSLLVLDDDGAPMREPGGVTTLACLCGAILRGDHASLDGLTTCGGTFARQGVDAVDALRARVPNYRVTCDAFDRVVLSPFRTPDGGPAGLVHLACHADAAEVDLARIEAVCRALERVLVETRRSAATTSLSQMSVLVVDDDKDVRRVVESLLRCVVREVHGAANAHDALVFLRERWVDLVVSDLNMPGGSGAELHRWIADRFGVRAPCFVLMSGSPSLRDVATELGVAGLTKPFSLRELIAVLAMSSTH